MSPETTTDVAAAFDALLQAARRARARVGQLPGELTLQQSHLLEPLLAGEERGVGELALAAGVTAPTATRMLDALERDGVVVRRRTAEDRRCVRVSLTEAGAERAAAAAAARAEWRAAVFAGLSERERRDAARVLSRLSTLIEEHSA
jgi:MarR family transcriptional regulator, organic hydroperoxide resistance regulator